MVILHRLVGRPNALPAPRWTTWRVFAYGKFTPRRATRTAMWQEMCDEGGVKPSDGLATDPQDPSQALMVGPTLISNASNQAGRSQPAGV